MNKINKRPKVLHIITRYIGGGAEKSMGLQMHSLRHKYDTYLAVGHSYNKKLIEKFKKESNIPYYIIKSMKHNSFFSSFKAIIELKRLIEKEKFDIVHTHTTEAGIIGRIAAKLAKVPVIIHSIQIDPISNCENPILRMFLILCEKITSKFTDKYVSIANMITQSFLSHKIGNTNQYETIYSPFDFNEFKSKKKIKLPKGFNVCYVAILCKRKGVNELLQSAIDLKNEKINFIVVGNGELEEYMKAKIKEDNLKNVKMMGYRKDAIDIINSCNALVLPSYGEGVPRVIIEAMALKKPVIVTDVGGVKDVVKDGINGFLIPVGNSKSITEKVIILSKNKELCQKMGKEGSKSLDKFSVKENKKRFDEIYQKLLKEKVRIK